MTSLAEKIMNADKAIRELYTTMIEMLNQEDMDYKVEFQGLTWDFCSPMTKEEKETLDSEKSALAMRLMYDAFDKLQHVILKIDEDERDNNLLYVWANIANLQRATQKASTVSTIVSSDAYEVDEGTSKDLDYDSIYIQVQRKDLSDEEKWNFLLRGFVDKKSLARESDNSQ